MEALNDLVEEAEAIDWWEDEETMQAIVDAWKQFGYPGLKRVTMVFSFGSQSPENGLFTFVQSSKGHIYTWPDEKTARSFFKECKGKVGHLYQIDPDLSMARLIMVGKNDKSAPAMVEPTEKQKIALHASFVYPSLLTWAPVPGIVIA